MEIFFTNYIELVRTLKMNGRVGVVARVMFFFLRD